MSRKSFTAEFKAKVALEAMAGVKETFSVNRSGAKFRFRLKFEERVHLKLDGNLS